MKKMIENIEPKYFTDEFEDGITETSDILGNSDFVLSDLLNDERLTPLYTAEQMQQYAESVQKRLNIAIETLKYILKQPVSDEIISVEDYPIHIRWRANEALEEIEGTE